MVNFFHRCDVFESGFRVRLRGTHAADLCPVDDVLEPALVRQVEAAVAVHDFSTRPVATGFLGPGYVWSLTPLGGDFAAVTIERSRFPRRVDALARRHGLSDAQRTHLRYAAGGTDVTVVAQSMGIDAAVARLERDSVLRRVGVGSVEALVALASATPLDSRLHESSTRSYSMVRGAR